MEKDKDEIIKMIFDDKFDLKDKVILEKDVLPKVSLIKDGNARVEIKKYTPNKIILQTSAKTNTFLFISDNYYEGWKVSIDGENGKIYRANYSFRGVSVPKGIHEVVFFYNPSLCSMLSASASQARNHPRNQHKSPFSRSLLCLPSIACKE